MVPLIGQLSNLSVLKVIDHLLNASMTAVAVKVKPLLCRCGCGQVVPVGRKFVNQEHYDQSKGLSDAATEQLLSRSRQGVPKMHLAREFGVAHSTVYRLLRENG
jgi:hypothetical protein